MQNPVEGEAVGGSYIWLRVLVELGDVEIQSGWFVMTNDVIEGSRGKNWQRQQELVTEKTNSRCTPPPLVHAMAVIMMHRARTGERLYSDHPWTFTMCQEQVGEYQTVVGGFDAGGLHVDDSFVFDRSGVAAWRPAGSC